MKWIYFPEQLRSGDPARIGGKGTALFQLYNSGLPVPRPLCIGTEAYELYVEHNHLREKISLELYRKDLADMRWEEIWDISLNIQNLFIRGSMPDPLRREVETAVHEHFGQKPLAVRSSAPEEDGVSGSFAGLHESYINITTSAQLVKRVKKVWASLWSDRAILYRQELGLDVMNSTMAVVIQEFIEGETSGVMFTRNPLDASQMVIEAVHGLNQGLVDGAVAPDRWFLNRENQAIVRYNCPDSREFHVIRSPRTGVQLEKCDGDMQSASPLSDEQVQHIAAVGVKLEELYQAAQDIEWTLANGRLFLLQARPVTAENGEKSTDKRSWYLSLNRSYDNLLQLWYQIENKHLPEMDQDAERLSAVALETLTDGELATEITRRVSLNEKWTSTYWSDFIPFAHGVRLFGEMYNDIVEPEDPFEFVLLLSGQQMLSTDRNALLFKCAGRVQQNEKLRKHLENGTLAEFPDENFQHDIELLKKHFSMDFLGTGSEEIVNSILSSVILQYARLENVSDGKIQLHRDNLEAAFLEKSEGNLPFTPHKLLGMARASYRLRDDDNIHIGRIGQELERAVVHTRKLLEKRGFPIDYRISVEDLCRILQGEQPLSVREQHHELNNRSNPRERVKARQLLGQPASRGISKGRARVVKTAADFKDFQKGEVIVIDSIDPTMTFFAPLAAGIIERRGGMLIHGAIIAREYGIPCITGVVDATSKIHTGEFVTVDGYLGICTVQRPGSSHLDLTPP